MPFPNSIFRAGCFTIVASLLGSVPTGSRAAEAPQPLRETIYHLATAGADETNQVAHLRSISETAKLLRRSIPILIQRLDDESASVRGMAAVALGNLGPAAADAVPALMDVFPEQDNEVKSYIASAFGSIGAAAREAVPLLLQELEAGQNENGSRGYRGNVDVAIIRALGELKDPAAIPLLLELLYGSDTERLHASYALAKIGHPAIPRLIDSLPKDSQTHREAAQTLGRMGRIAFPALREVLENGSIKAKEGAIISLDRSSTYARVPPSEIVPLLIAALDDPTIRVEAAEAIGSLGSHAAEAVPALIELLEDPGPEVQQSAAYSLGSIGPAAKAAVPRLIPLLDSPEPMTRARAAFGLRVGPAAEPALPRLIELLDDPHPEVTMAAAHSLSHIGTPAAPAIPKLIALLDSDNRQVVSAARLALGGHGYVIPGIGTASVEPLRNALQTGSAKLRLGAAVILGKLGPMADAAIPDLQAALTDTDAKVREHAAWALGQIGPAAEPAVPALIETLQDEHPRTREKAAEALGRIAHPSAAEPLAEAIEATMANPLPKHPEQQMPRSAFLREALLALGRIGPEAESALPLLRRVAESDERNYVRVEAAKALAAIDPANAMPALRPMLEAPAHFNSFGFLLTQLLPLIPPSAEEVIPLLRRIVVEGSLSERMEAAVVLARFDSEAEAALGLLLTELQSEDTVIQRHAAEALGKLGPAAAPAVNILTPLLKSEDAPHWQILIALRLIRDERAIEPLLEFMRASPPPEAVQAAWAVLSINPAAEEPWQVLIENLRSERPAIRASVLDAFEDLNSPKALPALREARDDPHPRLRPRVVGLLNSMEP